MQRKLFFFKYTNFIREKFFFYKKIGAYRPFLLTFKHLKAHFDLCY